MLHIPLERIRLTTGEDVGVRALIDVQVRAHTGAYKALTFIVDPGSSISTIAVAAAREFGLIVPERSLLFTVNTAGGRIQQRRHPGSVQVRIAGFPGTFTWPCHFVEHAGSPPKAALGLAGVLDDLRLIFDGRYHSDAPHGTLTLELLTARGSTR